MAREGVSPVEVASPPAAEREARDADPAAGREPSSTASPVGSEVRAPPEAEERAAPRADHERERVDDDDDRPEADWDDVLDLNLKTAFFLSQAFGRSAIAEGRRGSIVNIASVLTFQGGIRVASYTASKHGIAGVTRLLACEWAGKDVNVNAIAPGYIVTNNTAALREDPDRTAAILARIPAGRWGEASDIGGAAVFLASDAARYIHGAVLPVDGGWLAR